MEPILGPLFFLLLLGLLAWLFGRERAKKFKMDQQKLPIEAPRPAPPIPKTNLEKIRSLREWVVLDVETTGLGEKAEIVEACVVNQDGEILFDEIVNPTAPIQTKASDKHGLTKAKVKDKPRFTAVSDRLFNALDDKYVVAYNANFDARLVTQTFERYGLEKPGCIVYCAMLAYAELIGEPHKRRHGEFRWWKLAEALAGEKIVNSTPHRAHGDAEATRQLVLSMQGHQEPRLECSTLSASRL